MDKALKIIDPKMVTSVGGIIIAIMMAYFLYDICVSRISLIAKAMTDFQSEDIKAKEDLAQALTRNAVAIEGNTKVIEQVLRDKNDNEQVQQ